MKAELSATLKGKSKLSNDNLKVAVLLLEEKIARELNISLDELRKRVFKLMNGEITIDDAVKEKK